MREIPQLKTQEFYLFTAQVFLACMLVCSLNISKNSIMVKLF